MSSGKISVLVPLRDVTLKDTEFYDRAMAALEMQTIADEIEVLEGTGPSVAKTLNQLLEKATGDYYVFHAYDDFWERDGLERIRGYIEEQYPIVWAVFTSSWNVDAQGNRIVERNPLDGLVAEKITGQMEFTKETGNTVNTAACIVRMDALRRLKERDGYIFDERLRYHEDWDLYLRMLKHRGKIVFVEGKPVSNWYDNPNGRHREPLFELYKQMIYSRIRSGYYD